VQLVLLHPSVAFRDCGHCLKYLYDEDTGKVEQKRDGSGPRERDKSCPPPCQTRDGCKKGTPEKPKSLTPQNWQAYEHYQECKAVGSFPADAVVKRNAAIIRSVEDGVERVRQIEFMTAMMSPRK
jgi:hypothetical protein